jgi:hypothetical protein
MLKPLSQWLCDRCGEVIRQPKDGYLEWIMDDEGAHSFKIVHHAPKSPLKPDGDCYHHTRHHHRRDMHLDLYVGPGGLAHLLPFLDLGRIHDPDEQHSPRVKNMREFVELMRRLTLPYYEEARVHWSTASEDGFFDSANEVWTYLPDTLKEIVERYGED